MQRLQPAPASIHQRKHFLPLTYHFSAPGLPQGMVEGGGLKERFLSGLIAPEGHSSAQMPHMVQYSVTPKVTGGSGTSGRLVSTLAILTCGPNSGVMR
jgi:hypothetical protein